MRDALGKQLIIVISSTIRSRHSACPLPLRALTLTRLRLVLASHLIGSLLRAALGRLALLLFRLTSARLRPGTMVAASQLIGSLLCATLGRFTLRLLRVLRLLLVNDLPDDSLRLVISRPILIVVTRLPAPTGTLLQLLLDPLPGPLAQPTSLLLISRKFGTRRDINARLPCRPVAPATRPLAG